MLRTQVLQAMDHNGWQILAITSPTAGCGKSVTACNLAMSIARLPERSVLLVDTGSSEAEDRRVSWGQCQERPIERAGEADAGLLSDYAGVDWAEPDAGSARGELQIRFCGMDGVAGDDDDCCRRSKEISDRT